MKVFVTGATGFVGSAVVTELLGAGHTVLGLARSDASAALLETAGAEVLRGSLEDLDSLRRAVRETDGVIHTAFNHDFSKFAVNCEVERQSIEAIGAELAGSGRPLVVTSGAALLAVGRAATEDDAPPPRSDHYPRTPDAMAFTLAARGVRASVVRLPPSTHGAGDHGFVPRLIDIARSTGISVYAGDGQNRWAATHRYDAAAVFRLALEKGAAGVRYHAAAEEGIRFKDIAELIGQGLNLPVVSRSAEAAHAHFGWIGMFTGIDISVASAITRDTLGWRPQQPGLLNDMREAGYFG